ncbi:MAG: hypothetical protein HOO89_03785 [Ferruginibacter sp.]|nr:hypothetical protein [Ferruginibacter sp.]
MFRYRKVCWCKMMVIVILLKGCGGQSDVFFVCVQPCAAYAYKKYGTTKETELMPIEIQMHIAPNNE